MESIKFTEKITATQLDNQGDMMVEYKRKKLEYKRKKLYDSKVRTGWIIPATPVP